jgi:hypothetical protein
MSEVAFYLSVGWYDKALDSILALPPDLDMYLIANSLSGHDALLLLRIYPYLTELNTNFGDFLFVVSHLQECFRITLMFTEKEMT